MHCMLLVSEKNMLLYQKKLIELIFHLSMIYYVDPCIFKVTESREKVKTSSSSP